MEQEEELYNKIVDLECKNEELSFTLNAHLDRATQLNKALRFIAMEKNEQQKIIDSLTEENRELREQVVTLEEKLKG